MPQINKIKNQETPTTRTMRLHQLKCVHTQKQQRLNQHLHEYSKNTSMEKRNSKMEGLTWVWWWVLVGQN
jgi:hypothetical protein